MHMIRQRRLIFIAILLLCLSSATALALYALRQNISLYYTPSELTTHAVPLHQEIRVGGIVVAHSVVTVPNTLKVRFQLTDLHRQITVSYEGILPDLFRDGQGVVAQGKLINSNLFEADQLLAKHDERYHPPGIAH